MLLTSQSFENNGYIPAKFTCDGGDINPELHIQNVPEKTKSLVLIMDDPDAPGGTFTHWLVWNIAASREASLAPTGQDLIVIKEDSVPAGSSEGTTDFGRTGYGGPCPPPGKPHRYFFKLYALDVVPNSQNGAGKKKIEGFMRGHILTKTDFIGLYKR